ncbi:unnamed protein product [Rotaria sordida]|uniref:Uncharacterized protein n=1 Tax=Rotaria sordida TaxID=392033 RepID=A0A815XEN1_9BILA|nr:unnamed protein product [Rotaria sordida]CAF1556561.1 unnamed protein product [Rotaria sordida]
MNSSMFQNSIESSLDRLDRLNLRYQRELVLKNKHYEDLVDRHYPHYKKFELPLNHNLIYIHKQTSIEILNHVINVASDTYNFILDTQNEIDPYPWATKYTPSLLQIKFDSFKHSPLILFVEVSYLKSNFSTRTHDYTKQQKIKQLFKNIFSPNKYIFAWGNVKEKLTPFYKFQLFTENDLNQLNPIDLHAHFREWYKLFFPSSLISKVRSKNEPYSLQTAIFLVFDEWLNTRMQYASWNCGIDTNLKTYHCQFSSKIDNDYYHFVRDEINYRKEMEIYAISNCFAIKKLMNLMLKQKPLSEKNILSSSKIIHYKRQKRPQSLV